MAVHPCPRCRALIPVGVQYCDNCRPVAEAQAEEARQRKRDLRLARYNKAYNKRRDPKYGQFYRSKDWKNLSRAKLAASSYRCEAGLDGCSHLAVEVHHVKPIRTEEGWNERLEWDGLQAVCIHCHNILDNKNFKRKQDPGVIDLGGLKK